MLFLDTEIRLTYLKDYSKLLLVQLSRDEASNMIREAVKKGNFYSFIWNMDEQLCVSCQLKIDARQFSNSIHNFVEGDELIIADFRCDPKAMMAGIGYNNYPVDYYLIHIK